ncbi:MAG TPA: hypothetical protein VKA68_04575 [bacterium]|nr:hypothetical protein [bacterium]
MTDLIRHARKQHLEYGFNEWYRAGDGTTRGQEWQTWSASMYIYAAGSVLRGTTPFFDGMRSW